MRSRLVGWLLPARLGTEFRWLWSASTLTNLGDGVLIAAMPLLVASLTRDPLAVAAAVFLQQVPWLLFGAVAGALVDRLDRRRLVLVVDTLRALVFGVLALVIVTDHVSLPIVLGAAFALGTAEALVDNATAALVPTFVPSAHLGIANSRLFGIRQLVNQLGGPPLGAFLFTVGVAVPFGVTGVCLVLAVVLISRVPPAPPAPVVAGEERPRMRHEIAEGLRWLGAHPPVRTLAVTIALFNVTFGAAMAVFVLYATEILGLGEAGYGVLISVGAVGGIIGAGAYGWLERHFSLATLMRAGLVIETVTHLSLALTRLPWVAALTMLVFGVHAVVWGTTSTTVRQRAVPGPLLGRVTSVYMIGAVGGAALGALVGGALAQAFGVLAPYWFGFAGSAVLTVVLWRTFDRIVHAAEVGEAQEGDPAP